MRYVVGIVSVFVVIAALLWVGLILIRAESRGFWLPIAFGYPEGENMQFYLGIPGKITSDDPPGRDFERVPLWGKWQEERFRLVDDGGNRIPLLRMDYSELMDGLKGSLVFVLYAELRQGNRYTCRYLRFGEEAEQFRYSFTVPSEPSGKGCLFMPTSN